MHTANVLKCEHESLIVDYCDNSFSALINNYLVYMRLVGKGYLKSFGKFLAGTYMVSAQTRSINLTGRGVGVAINNITEAVQLGKRLSLTPHEKHFS